MQFLCNIKEETQKMDKMIMRRRKLYKKDGVDGCCGYASGHDCIG